MSAQVKLGAKFTPGARSASILGVAHCVLCDWTETISTMSDVDQVVEQHLRQDHHDVVAIDEIEKALEVNGDQMEYFVVLKRPA